MSREINKIKLLVTTECNMACGYCMIKNTHSFMSFEIAVQAVKKLLFSSSGDRVKFVYFFGGEPLLNFDVIKQIVQFIKESESSLPFQVRIVICTNFTIVSDEILSFIVQNNIFLSISLGGTEENHNAHRVFSKQTPQISAYKITYTNIQKLQKIYKKECIGVGYVIVKKSTESLFSGFLHLLKSSFNHINFEVVVDAIPWALDEFKIFSQQYYQIVEYVLTRIEKGDFIFINTLNWHILRELGSVDEYKEDPLSYLTEIYPNGDILCSGFYSHLENLEEFRIGNVVDDGDINSWNVENYFRGLNKMEQFQQGGGYIYIKKFIYALERKTALRFIHNASSNNYFYQYIETIKEIYF